MQWTDEEPDAADLPNLLAHKDWAKDRVDEIDQVGRIVQNTVDGIGSAWVGEAAAAWKSGVSEIIEVLSQCKYEYQSLEAALGPLHSGLSSLRSSMDGVRQVEMAWGFTLQEHQGIAEQRASWLIVNDPASRGHSLETVPTIGCYPDDTPDIQRARIDLLAARDMVTTAEKVLAEAQAETGRGRAETTHPRFGCFCRFGCRAGCNAKDTSGWNRRWLRSDSCKFRAVPDSQNLGWPEQSAAEGSLR